MQLITVGDDWGGWHQEGDYVDTLLGSGTVRFVTETFTGRAVAHCHILPHEDEGCMTQMQIVDEKGNNWGHCLRPGVLVRGSVAPKCCASFNRSPRFGTAAAALMVPLILGSVLPLVLVMQLHANHYSYIMLLPLYAAMLLLTLAVAAWVVYLRWFRRGSARSVMDNTKDDGTANRRQKSGAVELGHASAAPGEDGGGVPTASL